MPIPRSYVYVTVDASFLLNGIFNKKEAHLDAEQFLKISNRLMRLNKRCVRIPEGILRNRDCHSGFCPANVEN